MPVIPPPRQTYVLQCSILPPGHHILQFSFVYPLTRSVLVFFKSSPFRHSAYLHNILLITDYTICFLPVLIAVKIIPVFDKKERNTFSQRHSSHIPISLYSLVDFSSYTFPILISISPSISSAAVHSPISIIPITTII